MANYSSSDLPKPKMGPVKRSPFQRAFREARAAGKKDFTFNGKKYSTELAKPKAESAPKAEAKAAAKPAGRAEIPGAGPYKAPASIGEGMSETRRNIANIASALPAARAVGMAGKAAQAASAGRAAAKAAPRVEPRVGRPVTTKLDDAAAAFSRPQARQASKDTGYTREAMPAKTAPKPTAAPKPRDEILKRQAAMREGRKSQEDYARDVMERGAEMGMKRGGMAKAYAKGGSVKGGGCETRSKKARFI